LKIGPLRGYVVEPHGPAGRELVTGDLALEGPDLGITVRVQGPRELRGAIVSVRQQDGAHDWESLRPLLAVNGVLHSPRIDGVQLARVGDRPAVMIVGALETPDSTLRMRRTLRIANVRSALRISTEVEVVRGAVPRTLQVVERVAFGGGIPMAPLHGAIPAELALTSNWLARVAGRDALVLGALTGELRVLGHSTDHGRVDLINFSDVWLPTRAAAKQRFLADAVLSASHAGLAQAVRALGWVRNKPFVEALAVLNTQPPDTQVEVVDAERGKLVVSAFPDDQRRAILPLPDEVAGQELEITVRVQGVEAGQRFPLSGPPYAPVFLTVPETSTLRVLVKHAATGEGLPARVRVLPLKGTRAPSLGPDWSADGALDTVVTAGGRADIRLAAGYYRLIVTHGPEWTIVDRSLELGVGAQLEVVAELERAMDPGRWVACELHVHQAPSSDSHVTLYDRVASLVAEGIAFVVPTDHNHVTDLSTAIAAQPLWGLFSVPGVEVTTEAPIFGHFNAYPYPLDPALPGQGAPEYRSRAPGELFSSLHAVDPELVVQVNHPRMEGGIGYFDVAEYDAEHDHGGPLWSSDFDALEVWNGFDLARWPNLERVFADWLSMLEHGHRVVATGSSDSHTIRSEGAGYPRTYIQAPRAGVAHGRDLIRALRAGRAFVTSGPLLNVRIGTHEIGDSLELTAGTMPLEVFVQTPAWMPLTTLRVYQGSTLLVTQPLGAPSTSSPQGKRYQRTLNLTLRQPGPLVVSVEGDATLQPVIARAGVRPFAFSNPIWLVRKGDLPVASEVPDADLLQQPNPR